MSGPPAQLPPLQHHQQAAPSQHPAGLAAPPPPPAQQQQQQQPAIQHAHPPAPLAQPQAQQPAPQQPASQQPTLHQQALPQSQAQAQAQSTPLPSLPQAAHQPAPPQLQQAPGRQYQTSPSTPLPPIATQPAPPTQQQQQQPQPQQPGMPPTTTVSPVHPPPPHAHAAGPPQQLAQHLPPPPPQQQPPQPQHPQQQQQPVSADSNPTANRPLNVRDALSYLDQVKVQFGDQPEVYNRFLDIMKDFKSQAIDTPGVIERVSNLFRGHPNLIMGFNTFLPPGYRIEPTNNPLDPVRVTTPRDMPVYNQYAAHQPASVGPSAPHQDHSPHYPHVAPGPYANGGGQPSTTLPPLSSMASHMAPGAPPPRAAHPGQIPPHAHQLHPQHSHPQHPQHSQHPQHPQHSQHPQHPQHPQHVSHIGPQPAHLGMPAHQQPQMAPQQTTPPGGTSAHHQAGASPSQAQDSSQRNRGPVEFNHAINYVNKIKNRFASEPETYKQFLEILQTYQREQKPIQEVYAQVQVLFHGAPDLLDEFKQFLPDNSSNQPGAAAAPQIVSSSKPINKKQIKRPAGSSAYPVTYAASPAAQIPPPKKKPRMGMGGTTPQTVAAQMPSAPSVMPTTSIPPPSLSRSDKPANSEEVAFFEKCKRVIGNKTSYNEFLKILNLFSQEIIEAKTLIERVEPFLARSPDLFDWFKKFVKYEEDEVIYNIPAERPEIDLRSCKRSGHSYRKLPKDVPRPVCSGREELEMQVLNNDWISHPVYVSETGFVTHKKTQYEEAMYKSEEERYEFDLNIEANLHVIALLEPIAKRIQEMTPEERSGFKLPPGLGGTLGYSVALYQRVIKKIYDKERGAEVIEALHQNPGIAVPVVLKRLKQKDEEWKRSQREWNKVWREIDAKNFAKALDHQGIHFKASDRKAMSVKSLVTEIEVLQREQREKRSNLANRYQFDFAFKKLDIFTHIRRLIVNYMDGNTTVSASDEERINDFLRTFVKRFFLIEDLPGYDDDFDEPNGVANGAAQSASDAMLADPQSPRKTLQTAHDSAMPDVPKPAGVATVPDTFAAMDIDGEPRSSVATAPTSGTRGDVNLRKRSSYSFYANTAIYAFFRLYQMLFSRLLKMREMSDELDGIPTRSDTYNTVALELGLQKESTTPSFTEKDRFTELIKNINLLINGDMDANDFEDQARNMFWTSGYLIFTVDRLIISLVKQMQVIVQDQKSMDLIALYYRDQEKPSTSSRQEAVYRLSAESLIQDENIYRLEFFVPERVLTIQLLGKDDQITDDSISSEEKWSLYVDQFVQLSLTEGLSSRRNEPFLKRNLPTEVAEDPPLNVETRSGLELKICVNTYKIFFVDNTEDYFRRRRSATSRSLVGLAPDARQQAEAAARTKRHGKFAAWLDGERGWKRGVAAGAAGERVAAFDAWKAAGPLNESALADLRQATSPAAAATATVPDAASNQMAVYPLPKSEPGAQ
ncbi:hypothetical protein HK105_202107 [Polyrhizophydium stewartii]|uniref:Histone deacetylase interacting domain-containing protein n=1 Tax=Polyrhizophydium stewartii TaxID=2732419 RepID=A0ABR4NFB7_9FUNG